MFKLLEFVWSSVSAIGWLIEWMTGSTESERAEAKQLTRASARQPEERGAFVHRVLGTVTPRDFGQLWTAQLELRSPPASVLVKMRGDDLGPEAESQRRAVDLVERWSEIASDQLRLAVQETGANVVGTPYRSSSNSKEFFSRHALDVVVFDARRLVSRLHVRLRGGRERVTIRVRHKTVSADA